MKRTKKLCVFAITCVWVLMISCGLCARGEIVDPTASREWHAYGGHTMTASMVKLSGDAVVLKGADGSVRNVPLHMLIPEDQALAKEWGARIAAGGTHAIKPGKGKELATFAEGPGKGNFAFYEHENFVVSISPVARISIQCLEAGKPVGKPVGVEMGHRYQDLKARTTQTRKIVSFTEAYHPVLQPDVVTLEGVLSGNVPFGFTLAIEGKSIHVSGWVEDPTPSGDPTDYAPTFRFPRSHSFEAHVLVADQKIALKPYSLEVNPLRGKVFTIPYGDRAEGYDVPIRSVSIKGPIFGIRRLSVAYGSSSAGEMRLQFAMYPMPYTGFRVRLLKKDATLRDSVCRMTLTID